MTDNDVKKIAKVVKSEIKEALLPINKKLDENSGKLDNHTASLVSIEATLAGYADMYKVNKNKTEELDQRVDSIEEQIGITPQK